MNVDTARAQQLANMIGQSGPTGSLTYNQTGTSSFVDSQGRTVEMPMWQANTQLSPEQQQIFNTNQATQGTIANIGNQQAQFLGQHLSRPLTDDFSGDRQRFEEALFERMQPQLDRDREALETRLANQGLRLGSQAHSAAQDNMQRGVNDARLGAILQGGQEQSRSLSNAITLRNQPINEITALMSGSQVQAPQFGGPPQTQVGGVDYGGLVGQNYMGQMNAYNARMGSRNAMMGGLFGLGAAGLGLL